MGKPRMIIVIRHAQSEGNQNRQIHQKVPDHRVKLTNDGWNQAYDAGRRLRSLLRPDDTLQIYTSPYQRTRETTEGILQKLTSNENGPSPFSRQSIKIWEEPRLREQDFGNFQPNTAAMEKMWQERAEYGHFFYRIPNGESAADAYDRISGFNESLWRSFSEPDFPSVCILVTHGLMTRVFLMKWYHWSVEYFEDLRNINHCEFVVMERNRDGGKYILRNELRTWTELRRQRAIEALSASDRDTISVPKIPERTRWGAANDDEHSEPSRESLPNRSSRIGEQPLGPRLAKAKVEEEDSEAFPRPDSQSTPLIKTSAASADESEDNDSSDENENANIDKVGTAAAFPKQLRQANLRLPPATSSRSQFPTFLEAGRDFGGTSSGAPTPGLEGSLLDSSGRGSYQSGPTSTAVLPDVLGGGGGGGDHASSGTVTPAGSATPPREDLEQEQEERRDRSIRNSIY